MVTHVFLPVLHSDLFYISILIAIFEGMRWVDIFIFFVGFFPLERHHLPGALPGVLEPAEASRVLLPEGSSAPRPISWWDPDFLVKATEGARLGSQGLSRIPAGAQCCVTAWLSSSPSTVDTASFWAPESSPEPPSLWDLPFLRALVVGLC